MSSYDAVAMFLAEIGAVRVPDGPEPARRSTWRMGNATLVVSEHAGGAIGVDEVLVSAGSVSRAVDVIGSLHAKHIAPRENGRIMDSAAE